MKSKLKVCEGRMEKYNGLLKTKLQWLIFLSSSGLVLLFSSLLAIHNAFVFQKQFVQHFYALADTLSEHSKAALRFNDPYFIEQTLKAYQNYPDILLVYVFDKKEEIFVKHHHQNIDIHSFAAYKSLTQLYNQDLSIPTAVQRNHFFRDNTLDIFVPVIYEGDLQGTVYLKTNLLNLYQTYFDIFIGFFIINLIAWLSIFMVANGIANLILRPLVKLQTILKQTEDILPINEFKSDELKSIVTLVNQRLTHYQQQKNLLILTQVELRELINRYQPPQYNLSQIELVQQLQRFLFPKSLEQQQFQQLNIVRYMQFANHHDYCLSLTKESEIFFILGEVKTSQVESAILHLILESAVHTLFSKRVLLDLPYSIELLKQTIQDYAARLAILPYFNIILITYQNNQLKMYGYDEDFLIVRRGGLIEHITVQPNELLNCEVHLDKGDIVVLYTHGLLETYNEQQEKYGLERLVALLNQHWQASAEQLQNLIMQSLNEFRGNYELQRDVTLLILKQEE